MEQIKEPTDVTEVLDNENDDATTISKGAEDGESGRSLNYKLGELGLTRSEYFKLKSQEDTETKEAPKKESEASEQVVSDDALLGRLEARGIMDVEDQQLVINGAKSLGISPVAATEDSFIKGKLEENAKLRKQQAAATDSKAGAGGTNEKDSADYWLKQDQDVLPPKGQTALRREVINKRLENSKKVNMFGG